MPFLRSATIVVADAVAAAARYVRWFDYRIVEDGLVSDALAASWDAPNTAGRRHLTLRPASGLEIDLRIVEGAPVESYRPLRTFGWAALEICVQDTEAIHARMLTSPFDVIGPPCAIKELPEIYPMQVRGPDDEIIYLTEIRGDPAMTGLPLAAAPIDCVFIAVLGCRDLVGTKEWFRVQFGLHIDESKAIVYKMINSAFELPDDTRHDIAVGRHGGKILFEFDQYPAAAEPRRSHTGMLPPGIALCTLLHLDFDAIVGPWITAPTRRDGPIYGGRRVGVMRTPEGSLLEIVDGRP